MQSLLVSSIISATRTAYCGCNSRLLNRWSFIFSNRNKSLIFHAWKEGYKSHKSFKTNKQLYRKLLPPYTSAWDINFIMLVCCIVWPIRVSQCHFYKRFLSLWFQLNKWLTNICVWSSIQDDLLNVCFNIAYIRITDSSSSGEFLCIYIYIICPHCVRKFMRRMYLVNW